MCRCDNAEIDGPSSENNRTTNEILEEIEAEMEKSDEQKNVTNDSETAERFKTTMMLPPRRRSGAG